MVPQPGFELGTHALRMPGSSVTFCQFGTVKIEDSAYFAGWLCFVQMAVFEQY